jgi:hypothetical protein
VIGWIVFFVLVLAAVAGMAFYLWSLKRWQLPPPTTSEAKQAEAQLWATKNMPAR